MCTYFRNYGKCKFYFCAYKHVKTKKVYDDINDMVKEKDDINKKLENIEEQLRKLKVFEKEYIKIKSLEQKVFELEKEKEIDKVAFQNSVKSLNEKVVKLEGMLESRSLSKNDKNAEVFSKGPEEEKKKKDLKKKNEEVVKKEKIKTNVEVNQKITKEEKVKLKKKKAVCDTKIEDDNWETDCESKEEAEKLYCGGGCGNIKKFKKNGEPIDCGICDTDSESDEENTDDEDE